jgi:hypothetical protein
MALKNYLDDEDLRAFFPNIQESIWNTQQDYSIQIDKAYDKLINDLYNVGIEPRLVMPHLDLKLASTETIRNSPLTISTETTSTTGSAYISTNYRRMVLNVTAHSGSNTVKLQGSNDLTGDNNSVPDNSWEDVPLATITIAADDEVGQPWTEKFRTQYRYYRYVSTIGGSLTYSISLVETVFDDIIAYGALYLIFRDWTKETGDIWDLRSQQCEKDYFETIKGLKYTYDANADNVVEGEVVSPTFTIGFDR